MARRLTTNAQIDAFIRHVIRQAEHHAPNVAAVIEPLSERVRDRIDLSTDRIEVYQRNGQMARTCWVTINGIRYAFSYNYEDRKIDLRDRGIQGDVISQFDNDTTDTQLRRMARSLGN